MLEAEPTELTQGLESSGQYFVTVLENSIFFTFFWFVLVFVSPTSEAIPQVLLIPNSWVKTKFQGLRGSVLQIQGW